MAQAVTCLPFVQEVRDSIPGEVENFIMEIVNLGARRSEDVRTTSNCYIVHLRPGLNSKPFRSKYVEKAYCIDDSDSSVGRGR